MFFELKINVDPKNSENKNYIEDLHRKYNNLYNELEAYQKQSFEKIKKTQDDQRECVILMQENSLKVDEARENKMNERFKLYNEKFSLFENELSLERQHKDNIHEMLKHEIENSIKECINKISEIEKNTLLTETKLISFSKEYIQGFSDLITQYNSKYDLEIEKLRSIHYTMIEKIELDYNKSQDKVNHDLNNFKSNVLQLQTRYNELESESQQKYNEFNNLINSIKEDSVQIKGSIYDINANKNDIKLELTDKFNSEIAEKIEKNEDKLLKQLSGIKNNIRQVENTTNKEIVDMNDKHDMLNKVINQNVNDMNKKIASFESLLREDTSIREQNYDIKIEKVKLEIDEFKKKLITMMNLHIDSFKSNLSIEQKELIDLLSIKLNDKTSLLENDFKKNQSEFRNILEGKLQGMIVSFESKINETISKKLNSVQEYIERLNVQQGNYNADRDNNQNNIFN